MQLIKTLWGILTKGYSQYYEDQLRLTLDLKKSVAREIMHKRFVCLGEFYTLEWILYLHNYLQEFDAWRKALPDGEEKQDVNKLKNTEMFLYWYYVLSTSHVTEYVSPGTFIVLLNDVREHLSKYRNEDFRSEVAVMKLLDEFSNIRLGKPLLKANAPV